MTAANSFSPTTHATFCAGTNRNSGSSLASVEEQYPRPNNSLVALLTAAYTFPPQSSLESRPRVQPLQPSQIAAIVDDVLRELDDEIEEEVVTTQGLVLGTDPSFLDLTRQ